MTTSWKFFGDAGLTADLSAGIPVAQVESGGATDVVVYYGSTSAGVTLQAASDPGFDPITVTPVDAAGGSGVETSMLKLATSQGGLDGATPGAALTLGTTLTSGIANAMPVWIRVDAGALSAAVYTDAGLEVNSVVET